VSNRWAKTTNKNQMLIINGTIRNASTASKIQDYVLHKFRDKIKFVLNLFNWKSIPDEYLKGTGESYLFGHNAVVLILSSYYVMPPAAFLNWLNQLDSRELIELFADKTVFIISAQAEGNLNEVPVNIIRTLLLKVFDYNNIEAKICIKHCMVNEGNLNDGRIDMLLNKYC
jgi:hypothetical protein